MALFSFFCGAHMSAGVAIEDLPFQRWRNIERGTFQLEAGRKKAPVFVGNLALFFHLTVRVRPLLFVLSDSRSPTKFVRFHFVPFHLMERERRPRRGEA